MFRLPHLVFVFSVTFSLSCNGTITGTGAPSRTAQPESAATHFGEALSVHTKMGIPQDALPLASSSERYLIVRPQYVMSFNAHRRNANWVSWELNATWLGTTPRAKDFVADNMVDSTLTQATGKDYQNSGYDRGHLCPSGDRTLSRPDNDATFVYTNVTPQLPAANQGPWVELENESRSLARSGKELFITSGPVYGIARKTIGEGVEVPVYTFKVIAVTDSPNANASDMGDTTRVIAVLMPNDATGVARDNSWKNFRTTVREIENVTGLDFFSDVPKGIQDRIETQVDTQ